MRSASSISRCPRRRSASGAPPTACPPEEHEETRTMYAFEYQRPSTRDAAKAAAAGADTRYLAGGQSLIQAMRLRLSQSERLVDLGAIAELKQSRAENNGVTIGAMATHAQVASNADVKRVIPAIAELAGGIGDPMVRNMGTIGGSIANADPAACYPAGVPAVNATIQTERP